MRTIPFTKPYFSDVARAEILVAIDRILASGQLILGEYTVKLEAAFAAYTGCADAVTSSTCTSALQMCLEHYDVRGREVLVPAAGFITDVTVVKWAGGTPVLVDTDPATLSFDLDDLARKLTPRTKGLIWVHLTGLISPAWREIVAFARERGLFLIEDCAHAHGATVAGHKAGSLGDVGCFSFYPTKIMTTGTGGILTTSNPALARTARELRNFGKDAGVGAVVREGHDWLLDEVRACLGCFQLQELEENLAARGRIAQAYQEAFAGVAGVRCLTVPADQRPSWYHYTLFVDPPIDYDRLATGLSTRHGIPTKPIYPPLHHERIFRDLDTGTLGQSEAMLGRSLCLPLYPEMTTAQVTAVIAAVKSELAAQASAALPISR